MCYKIKIKNSKNSYKITLFISKRNFVFSLLLNRRRLMDLGFNATAKSVRSRLLISGNILEKLVKIGIIS